MKKERRILLMCLLFLTGCVSTKPKLGIENGALTKCPGTPNCVSSMEAKDSSYIEPIIVMGTQQEVKEKILEILGQIKNTNIVVTEDNYIRAEFKSNFFHFIDDVEFYFPYTDSKEIIIHVRSASRVGHSDFGVNRERIELLRNKLSH